MKMSAAGRALLIQREGFRTKAYRDSVGVWTIGVGHTAAAGPPFPRAGMTISRQEVEDILTRDLVQYENAVRNAVKVPLSQGQFDALVSFCFNIGTGGFKKSTVVRRLNEGNYRAAADALLMWNKPPEIMGRRRSERQQFLAATQSGATGQPVKFMAAADLEDGEAVNIDYLRAADSRTVTLADKIKGAAAGIGVSDALATATQAKEYATQAHELAQGFKSGAPLRELLSTYAPLLLGVTATVLIALIVFLVWRAANGIQKARLEDAVYE